MRTTTKPQPPYSTLPQQKIPQKTPFLTLGKRQTLKPSPLTSSSRRDLWRVGIGVVWLKLWHSIAWNYMYKKFLYKEFGRIVTVSNPGLVLSVSVAQWCYINELNHENSSQFYRYIKKIMYIKIDQLLSIHITFSSFSHQPHFCPPSPFTSFPSLLPSFPQTKKGGCISPEVVPKDPNTWQLTNSWHFSVHTSTVRSWEDI